MKKVLFGQHGGFPLEQETLENLQYAYANDMLETLLGQWGIDENKKYLVKEATAQEDGFILTKVVRSNTVNDFDEDQSGVELVRLKFSTSNTADTIYIIDRYNETDPNDSTEDTVAELDGTRVFGAGDNHKIYEELIAICDVDEEAVLYSFPKEDLLPLPTLLELEQDINEIGIINIGDTGQNVYKENTDTPFELRKVIGENGVESGITSGDNVFLEIDQAWLDGWMLENYSYYYSSGDGTGDLNDPPEVNVLTPATTIQLPTNQITLAGTVTDSDGNLQSYQWSVSGPSTPSIVSPNSLSTVVNGLIQGSYVFTLTAIDTDGATASDSVSITVQATQNIAPTVGTIRFNDGTTASKTVNINSGSSYSINMTSTASDSDGTITTYQWQRRVNNGSWGAIGANTSTFNQNLGDTAGIYEYRLKVIDNDGAESLWSNVLKLTLTVVFQNSFFNVAKINDSHFKVETSRYLNTATFTVNIYERTCDSGRCDNETYNTNILINDAPIYDLSTSSDQQRFINSVQEDNVGSGIINLNQVNWSLESNGNYSATFEVYYIDDGNGIDERVHRLESISGVNAT